MSGCIDCSSTQGKSFKMLLCHKRAKSGKNLPYLGVWCKYIQSFFPCRNSSVNYLSFAQKAKRSELRQKKKKGQESHESPMTKIEVFKNEGRMNTLPQHAFNDSCLISLEKLSEINFIKVMKKFLYRIWKT